MAFLITLCLIVIGICFAFLKNNWNTVTFGFKALVIAIAIAASIGMIAAFANAISDGSSSSSKTRYSDLNDTEKANAKWAYEAQQAAKNYKYK